MSKTLETRIQNKIDTEANWKTSDLIPLSGELIIYDVDDTHSQPRIKFGDGVTVADKLPFTRTPGNYWTPDLRPAPYLYLKCNNTTTPEYGHVTLTGTDAYEVGKKGYALSLTEGNYITGFRSEDVPLLTDDDVEEFSVSFWCKSDPEYGLNWLFYVSNTEDVYTRQYVALLDYATQNNLVVERGDINDSGEYIPVGAASTTYTAGEWKHIVLIVKQSSTSLYLNGKLISQAEENYKTTLSDILSKDTVMYINRGFAGETGSVSYDEYKVFPYALTPDEVTRLYEDIDSSDDAQEPEDPEEVIKQPLTVPTANITTFTYNGISQGPGWVYDTTVVTMSGTATATNAGTYTTTFSIKDKEKYYWEDTNDTTDKKLEWTINKDTHNVATPVSVKVWDIEPTHFNAYSDVLGDPTYAQSEDTSIATVSVDTSALTNNVTVNFVSEGDTTITLVWEDSNYVTVTRTVAVTCAVKQFRDYTWAEIAELSQNDNIPDTWEVGEELKLGSYTITIIGKNHDTDSEGTVCPITLQVTKGAETDRVYYQGTSVVDPFDEKTSKSNLHNALIAENVIPRNVLGKCWDSSTSVSLWLPSVTELLGESYVEEEYPSREDNDNTDGITGGESYKDTAASSVVYRGTQYEYYVANSLSTTTWTRSTGVIGWTKHDTNDPSTANYTIRISSNGSQSSTVAEQTGYNNLGDFTGDATHSLAWIFCI